MFFRISLKRSLEPRGTNEAVSAGLRAALLPASITALFTFFTMLFSKEELLDRIAKAMEKSGSIIPLDIHDLYLISLILPPTLTLLFNLVLGIFLGLIFNKFRSTTPLKVLLLSLPIGLGFGLITNLPTSKLMIIFVNLLAWLLFAFLFLKLYEKEKEKRIKRTHRNGKVMMFLVLVFILSSFMTIVSRFLGIKLTFLAPLYMFIPLISTLITCHYYQIPLGNLGLSIKPSKWFLLPWLLPVILSLAALGVALFFPETEYSATGEG